jgi:hypothetical protein
VALSQIPTKRRRIAKWLFSKESQRGFSWKLTLVSTTTRSESNVCLKRLTSVSLMNSLTSAMKFSLY